MKETLLSFHSAGLMLKEPETGCCSGTRPANGSRPEEDFNEDRPAEYIGRYRLCRQLHQGGQGIVSLAWDEQLQRNVAIKISHELSYTDGLPLTRSDHEGSLLATIDHPHLARVFECGVDLGRPYLVLEYVPGANLRDYAQGRCMEARQIGQFMEQIASAVQAAHQAGVLHLDLKPENVMVTPDGHCKLVDFGLGWKKSASEAMHAPVVAGTSGYLAPEQSAGEMQQWTTATDIFGLGGILHFLLQGSPPLPERQLCNAEIEKALRDTRRKLLRSGRSVRLIKACNKALQFDPRNRFISTHDFLKAIESRHPFSQKLFPAMLIFVGGLLVLLGLVLHLNDTVPPRDRKLLEMDSAAVNEPQTIAVRLKLSTTFQNPPRVLYWTPQLGLKELQGMKCLKQDGKYFWQPGGRAKVFSAHLHEDLFCLIILDHVFDMPDQISSQPHFRNHPQISESRILQEKLSEELKPLKVELDRMRVPYTCFVSSQTTDSSHFRTIHAELDLTPANFASFVSAD